MPRSAWRTRSRFTFRTPAVRLRGNAADLLVPSNVAPHADSADCVLRHVPCPGRPNFPQPGPKPAGNCAPRRRPAGGTYLGVTRAHGPTPVFYGLPLTTAGTAVIQMRNNTFRLADFVRFGIPNSDTVLSTIDRINGTLAELQRC